MLPLHHSQSREGKPEEALILDETNGEEEGASKSEISTMILLGQMSTIGKAR